MDDWPTDMVEAGAAGSTSRRINHQRRKNSYAFAGVMTCPKCGKHGNLLASVKKNVTSGWISNVYYTVQHRKSKGSLSLKGNTQVTKRWSCWLGRQGEIFDTRGAGLRARRYAEGTAIPPPIKLVPFDIQLARRRAYGKERYGKLKELKSSLAS